MTLLFAEVYVVPKMKSKIVESTQDYMSFAEVAVEAKKKNISVAGYKMSKVNRRQETIGNAIVITKFLEEHNKSAGKIPWGEILGYGGANRKVKCIKKSDLSAVLKGLKAWSGKPMRKPRRKKYKVFSEFSSF